MRPLALVDFGARQPAGLWIRATRQDSGQNLNPVAQPRPRPRDVGGAIDGPDLTVAPCLRSRERLRWLEGRPLLEGSRQVEAAQAEHHDVRIGRRHPWGSETRIRD